MIMTHFLTLGPTPWLLFLINNLVDRRIRTMTSSTRFLVEPVSASEDSLAEPSLVASLTTSRNQTFTSQRAITKR